MQRLFMSCLVLALGAEAALAQTAPLATPAPSTPLASAASVAADAKQSKQRAHAAAIADCEGMWDRATHMTRTEWSRTCRRVQARLEQLELR